MGSLWAMILLSVVSVCNSARILVFQHSNSKSHVIVTEPLYEELASRGHQLTVFTRYTHKRPFPNLEEISLASLYPSTISNFSYDLIKNNMPNPFQTPLFVSDFELDLCEKIFPFLQTQEVLNSEAKFDLIIAEIFAADCFIPFAHKFNTPFISIVASTAIPWMADRMGLPDNPSYIPNFFTDFSTDMNFYERMYNSVNLVYSKILHSYYTLPRTNIIVTKYFGNSLPPINEILNKRSSLMLINGHISLSSSRPFPPNVVEIGGVHIKSTPTPLPKDLQDILDQSTHGVILMSLGSLIRAATIPHHIIEMFMNVFSTIPQTVIFKFEEDWPKLPPNVVLRKWLPQRDIVEHKNVKALLLHGGQTSTIEAVYFGKPLIGIPFFTDQHQNINALVRRGAGLMLDLDNLSEQKIKATIKEILENPTYSENMNRLSYQFRDRPMTPLQTAVYWTEYVIRHQGAPHLRPASVNLPLYKYLLLDVVAVLFLPLLLGLYVMYFLFFRAVKISPNDYRNYKLKKDN